MKTNNKTKVSVNEISINNEVYVKKGTESPLAASKDGLEYCIVRSQGAGVFAGYVKSRSGAEVVLLNARRIYYWDGAATLSQLAMSGTSKPQNCKFPEEVNTVTLIGVVEIIPCTHAAKDSIASVKVWKA